LIKLIVLFLLNIVIYLFILLLYWFKH